ncbi:hypothetical protein [Flammeovirga sp. SJP92]|uniref:hypothetical protein n=1 Tax=Flammeovirga sp. SJP92 TaxID=1775430 RepID=UPI000786E74A|nr:hypothetical protein [Flammeovirga sp. SJP92]KXX67414.1 hypothetical protein AVL50_26965 [Flammeovirga sp. SJP92]
MYERLERSKSTHSRDYDSYNAINIDPYEEQRPKQLIAGYFFFVDNCLYYVRRTGEEEPYFSLHLNTPVEISKYRKSVKVGELSNFKQPPLFIYREMLFHRSTDQAIFENELQQNFQGAFGEIETLKKRAPEEVPCKLYVKNDKVCVTVLSKEGLYDLLQALGMHKEDITPLNSSVDFNTILTETDVPVTLILGALETFFINKDASLLPAQLFSSETEYKKWRAYQGKKARRHKEEIENLRKAIKEQGEVINIGQVRVNPKLNENVFIHYDITVADLKALKLTIDIGSSSQSNQPDCLLTEELQEKIEKILLHKMDEWELYLFDNAFYFFQNTKKLSNDIPYENSTFGFHLPEQIILDFTLLEKLESSLFNGQYIKNNIRLEEEFYLKPLSLDYDKLIDDIIQLDQEFNKIDLINHYINALDVEITYAFAYMYCTIMEDGGLLEGKHMAEQKILNEQLSLLPDLQKMKNHPPSIDKLKQRYAEKTGGDTALVTLLKKRMYEKGFIMSYFLSDHKDSPSAFDADKIGSKIYVIANKAYYDLNSISPPESKGLEYDRELYISTSKSFIVGDARKAIQKELDHLSGNPEKFKQLDQYCISKYDEGLIPLLQRTQVWYDGFELPKDSYLYEWVTVKWLDVTPITQEDFEKEKVDKESDLQGWLIQDENDRFRYKLGDGDTVESVGKYLDVTLTQLREVNQLSKENVFQPTGDQFLEQKGSYLLLPVDYAPGFGQKYYQETIGSGDGKEYRKVERVKGSWQQKVFLNYAFQTSLYGAFLNYLPADFFEDTMLTNSLNMDLQIQITPFIIANFRLGVGFGEHLSLERGDDRKISVNLSTSMVAVLKTISPYDDQIGANFQAGKEYSTNAFKSLNGSYDSYRHFFAYLQLEIFKKFGSTDQNKDKDNLLLNPKLWDESVKKELLKGYKRVHIDDKNIVKGEVNLPNDILSISGEYYTLEQSSEVVEGLKKTDFTNGKWHLMHKTDDKVLKTSSESNKVTYAEIDVSCFDSKLGVKGTYQNIEFHSNKDNIGKYLSLSFCANSDLSLSEVFKNKNNYIQLLGTSCGNIIDGFKKIAPSERKLAKGSKLADYFNSHFKKLQAGKSSGTSSKGYMKFHIQMIIEEDGLHIQYIRVSAGGSVGAEVDTGVASLEGEASIEKELFEVSADSTLSYVSTVFNAIGQKELKKSTDADKELLSELIATLSKNVLREKGKPKGNSIPTTTKFLKTYGERGSKDLYLQLKDKLFSLTYIQWIKHIKKNSSFFISTHDHVQELTDIIQKGFSVYNAKGIDPETATWKGMGINWLSEEQCKNYLGKLDKVLSAYNKNPKAPFDKNAGTISSLYLQSVLNGESDTNKMQKFFFEDILFPLFIENQIHETLTYYNY